MRYHYFYQTSHNEIIDDWIVAKDRNDAYAQLRKKGIKPYKLLGRNPLAWKRWTAIGVLSAAVAVLAWRLANEEGERPVAEEPRAQLYGDPATIQQLAADGWRKAFVDEGNAWLARHAIPASVCDCGNSANSVNPVKTAISTTLLAMDAADSPELAKMKRMVNGMKQELKEFLDAGGSLEDYMLLCDERLDTERGLVEAYRKDFDLIQKKGGDVEDVWEKKNAELRSMGLPTVPIPDDIAE